RPAELLRVIEPRAHGHEYYVDHRGDTFYIRSNGDGALNFKLMTAPVADPQRKNLRELVPHRRDVMLEDVDLFADFMVLSEREQGLPRLRITDFKSGQTHYLQFPEPVYTASL